MKKYFFVLIPILVLLFGVSSYAAERIASLNWRGMNTEFTVSYDSPNCYPFAYLSSGAYTVGLLYLGDGNGSRYSMSITSVDSGTYLASFRTVSTFPYPYNISDVSFGSEFFVFNSYSDFQTWVNNFQNSIYDNTLTLNPKFLYGLNFIKLFLGKSSSVDNVSVTIDRIYDDGRPSETVFTNDYSDNNPYIEFWDDFDFPIEDIPHISYKMYLIPKDNSNNFGNTYLMDFRLRYNDISGVWKYDIDVPVTTHGGGGHERVPIEGINDYTITTINPTNNTVVSPPRTFYSPSVNNDYIINNDYSTEIYNYITNYYITESPQPIIDNTHSAPTSTDFDFPTLDGFLGVLKDIFSLVKNLFEMFVSLISDLIGQFTFLPPWFIICVSSLIGIAISVMIWLFVKNLIL